MRAGEVRGGRAALLRRAAGWGECAPGEPVAESALQRPRTAHCQPAGSNRAAEVGSSQVHAVERGGVDDDLQVDLETRMLETDRDLGRVENHPVTLLGLAKVELNHGSLGWYPPAIDVAGHPDDQQVGIELLRSRLGERPSRPPLADGLHDRLEVTAGGREAIFEGAPFGASPPLDDVGSLERAHAVGKHGARDPRKAALQLVEAARTAEHLAHDQKRPTVAEDLAGLGDRAVLRVAAHCPTMLEADRWQVSYSDRLVRK